MLNSAHGTCIWAALWFSATQLSCRHHWCNSHTFVCCSLGLIQRQHNAHWYITWALWPLCHSFLQIICHLSERLQARLPDLAWMNQTSTWICYKHFVHCIMLMRQCQACTDLPPDAIIQHLRPFRCTAQMHTHYTWRCQLKPLLANCKVLSSARRNTDSYVLAWKSGSHFSSDPVQVQSMSV
jgi:hypothetical protein